jgi:hypothetical protein
MVLIIGFSGKDYCDFALFWYKIDKVGCPTTSLQYLFNSVFYLLSQDPIM